MKKFYLLLLMLIYSSMAWATGIDANPALNNDGSNDPHMSGVWLLMLDRNNNELWYEMTLYDGDYSTIIHPYCYVFGFTYNWKSYFFDYSPFDNDIPWRYYYEDFHYEDIFYEDIFDSIIIYDARFCFVIDGVRYGPAENYKKVVLGDPFDNTLYENDNYYTMKTGYNAIIGVGFDNEGNSYALVGFAGIGGAACISYEQNFPKGMIDILKGDVDGDGRVTIADVTELIDLQLSGEFYYHFQLREIADVDGNGIVSIADVTALIDLLLQKS